MIIHHDEPQVPEEYINLLKESVVFGNTPCSVIHSATRVLDLIT